MKETVFVLEDEPDINRLVRDALEADGFATRGFVRADELLFAMQKTLPDLLILDLNLPDMDGMEIARQVKSSPRTRAMPLVMLTARVSEEDTLRGFDFGADDYIRKPFSVKEMVARVRRILRPPSPDEGPRSLAFGPVRVVPDANEAFVDEKRLSLSPAEFTIMVELVKSGGRTVRRTALLAAMASSGGPRTIDVYIRNLRVKLGKHGKMIESVRGTGYKLVGG